MFVKLFTQILDSSIADDRKLRHFFTDLLLCADCKGYIIMTPAAIARRISAPIEEVEWGLAELQKPDHNSKTPMEDGKRIEALDAAGYGWRIINYESYRAMKDADQMREATRRRVIRHREKKKNVTLCNVTETPCNANTEAEAEAEAEVIIPPNPQGGIPKKKRVKRSKNQTVDYNTIEMQRIGSWFGRKETTLWTLDEYEAYESIQEDCRGEAQINGMEYFYLAEEKENEPLYRRTTLKTLLNNWMGELEKARAYSKKNQ